MASLEQIEANRLNALKSTGPKTPEGKARSSMNALKHGLRSDRAVIPGEDPEEYEAFARWFLDECAPVGPLEVCRVRQMITAEWRLRRIERIENAALTLSLRLTLDYEKASEDPVELTQQLLEWTGRDHCSESTDIFTRYVGTYSRLFDRAYRSFIALRKLRQQQAETDRRTTAPKTAQTNPISRSPRNINTPAVSEDRPIRPPNLDELRKEVA